MRTGLAGARARPAISWALLVLGVVVLLAGVGTAFAWRSAGDPQAFAANARRAAADVRVQEVVAQGVADTIVAQVPALVSVKPVILRAARRAARREEFVALVFLAALDYRDLTLSREGASISVDLGAMGTVTASVVRRDDPELADRIPQRLEPGLVLVTNDGRAVDLMASGDTLEVLAWLLPLLGLVLLALAVVLAPRPGRMLLVAGVSLAVGAAVFYVAVVVLHAAVVGRFDGDPLNQDAADAILDVFLGPAPWWALTLGGIGLLVAATCWLLDRRDRQAGESTQQAEDEAAGTGRRRRWPLVAGVAATGLVVALAVSLATAGGDGLSTDLCNGHAELCDRRLDEVALVTSHNTMASARGGFLAGNQALTFAGQLDLGVRALQVDSYYGRPVGDRVVTEFPQLDVLRFRIAQRAAAGVVADLQARIFGEPTGPRDAFLCHNACELGAIPLADGVADLVAWLDGHPGEVVVVIIEDYVSPSDTEQAFRDAGALDKVHVFEDGEPLPTLRELLDAGTPLLVLAENDGLGPSSWYPAGYESVLMETPYAFRDVAELETDESCSPNRGGDDRPLFLLNHFVVDFPPRIGDARDANAYDLLRSRADRCRELRGQLPNLVSVDFVEVGDVVAVVDALNGVEQG